MLSMLALLATPAAKAQSNCPADADWCATMMVGTDEGSTIVNYGFKIGNTEDTRYGSLSDRTIVYGSRRWVVNQLRLSTGGGSNIVFIETNTALPSGTTITVDGHRLNTADADSQVADLINWQLPDSTFNWTVGQQVPVSGRLGNLGSSGKPAISGTLRESHVLSADRGNISDPDGTARADRGEPGYAYTYQWERIVNGDATAIAGATGRTYRLRYADIGAKVQVKIRFRDDRDNEEGPRTSDRTGTIRSDGTNSPPWFQSGGGSIEVMENTAQGTQIGDPSEATDAQGDTVTYSLDEAGEAIVDIHPTTGQLTLRTALDYETKHQHVFEVHATDEHGARAEQWNSILVLDVEEPPLAPAAPTITMVEANYLVLAWTAPETTGPEITSYNVRYRPASASAWNTGPQRVRATDTMLTGLNPGRSYDVQVQATNDEGDGRWSPSATATTFSTALDPDTTLVGLTVSSGALSPAFAKRTTEYVVDVDDTVRTITIEPTRENARSFVAYLDENGATHQDEHPDTHALDLAPSAPETTVRVKITSRDGMRSKTYTLTVHRIGRPARIRRLEFFNLPSRGHYEPGGNVDVVVRLDKPVEVTGTPIVSARLGRRLTGLEHRLTYVASESQPRQLLFRGLMDGRIENSRQITVDANSVNLNGGSIRTRGTDIDANLKHGQITGLPAITRVIENITLTSTASVPTEKHGRFQTYGPGETVQFTVHLSQPVVVSNDVVIGVLTPSTRHVAEYSSGSGSEKLVFEWIVPDDDGQLSIPLTLRNNHSGTVNAGLQIGSGTFNHANGTIANFRHERFEFPAAVHAIPPEIIRATINGATVTIEYKDILDTDFVPGPSAFEVQTPDETVSDTVTDVTVTASRTVILTLSAPVGQNDVRNVRYLDDEDVLRDIFGNKATASTTRARNDTPANVNTPATGVPVIQGFPQEGQPLTVALSLISDPDGGRRNITYRWIEVGAVPGTIEGATGKTYHPTADLVGKSVRVEVRFTDSEGHAEGPLLSIPSAPVLARGRQGDLRLIPPSGQYTTGSAGRLEVFHSNQWGTVCDDRFDGSTNQQGNLTNHYAPEVACKQIGLETGRMYTTGRMVTREELGMSMAPLSQPIWLDDVHCAQTGSRLASCNHAGWGLHNCGGQDRDHSEDVHLVCSGGLPEHEPLTATLPNAPTAHSGDEFNVRILFSEDVDAQGQSLLQGRIHIQGANSSSIAPVDNRQDLWELTIQPTAGETVYVVAFQGRECGSGVCTPDGRPLSHYIQHLVHPKARLTARFTSISVTQNLFARMSIVFSEPIAPGFSKPVSEEVLEVTNGEIITIVEDFPNTYILEVRGVGDPLADDAVFQIRLKGNHACDLEGAACTPDGRRLSADVPIHIRGDGTLPPLTARFVNQSQPGTGFVDVYIIFSEPIAAGFTGNRTTPISEEVLEITNGRVNSITELMPTQYYLRVDPRSGVPIADDEEYLITLKGDHACDLQGAICTADRRRLSADASITILGDGTLPAQPQQGRALSAEFADMPTGHGGASQSSLSGRAVAASPEFTFTVRFSESFPISYLTMRDHVFTVTNGRVTRARRLDNPHHENQGLQANREWEITVAPDTSAGDVTVTLPETTDCAATGAVCTEDGTMLSATVSVTVPHTDGGPTIDVGPAPLTAQFANVPAEHDGDSEFAVELRFSEPPAGPGWYGARNIAVKNAIDITGGTVVSARSIAQNGAHRRIVVQPSGTGAVTLSLPPGGPACDEAGALCTEAGGRLETGALTQIRGPAALSVADAEVREEPGAELAFAVTLDRPTSAAVRVDYATSDGTAEAGSDYTATSGTLTFAGGETAKTITVPVLDDAHDEGSETMTLVLSNPSGAYLADGEATGTIENSDPMPKAWMVRFGRTVGGQVVDALNARLDGAQRSHVTVAGINVMGAPGAEPEIEDDDPFGLSAWARDAQREEDARSITADDILLRSAFHLSSGRAGAGAAFSAWGHVATGGFEADVDDVTMDGDVTTGMVGFDAEWERGLAGVMLSQSTGDGAYRLDPAQGDDAGTVKSDLTGLYPYARIELNERVSAWGLAGAGSGSITLTQDGKGAMKTDLSMRMGALGVKGRVLDGSGPSGLGLNVKSDAMWVGTKSARSKDMVGTAGDVTRLRLIVEGERIFDAGSGATFTPSAQVGLRHDGGDAETGSGVEVGAGLRYSAGALTVEGQVRGLLAHEDSAYEEWGASGAIRVTPTPSGRGLTLSIAPAWGRTGSAAERLWSARDASGLGADSEFEADSRIAIDAGYGFGLPGNRGVLTPYAGLTLGNAGARTMRTGTRWRLSPHTVLSVEGTRQVSDASESAIEVRLRAALRF